MEEGIRILADREQMRRVLINLLKNAEQSIPEGRQGVIRITVRKKEGKWKSVSAIMGKVYRKIFGRKSFSRILPLNPVAWDWGWLSVNGLSKYGRGDRFCERSRGRYGIFHYIGYCKSIISNWYRLDLGVDFDWICRGGREYGRSVVLDGEKTETAKGSSG